jgi:hypothetical protein
MKGTNGVRGRGDEKKEEREADAGLVELKIDNEGDWDGRSELRRGKLTLKVVKVKVNMARFRVLRSLNQSSGNWRHRLALFGYLHVPTT